MIQSPVASAHFLALSPVYGEFLMNICTHLVAVFSFLDSLSQVVLFAVFVFGIYSWRGLSLAPYLPSFPLAFTKHWRPSLSGCGAVSVTSHLLAPGVRKMVECSSGAVFDLHDF